MPPKKKSKANKLARMTDEERARYLQHRADIEEEARRRKQQLIATFMKNKLKREEAFSRLNLAKINQQWRHILRSAKCEQMQEDLKKTAKNFDRVVECKKRVVDELMQELCQSEMQYGTNLQNHLEVIDKLIKFHHQTLDEMQEQFNKNKSVLMTYSYKELSGIYNSNADAILHLKQLVYHANKVGSEKVQLERENRIIELQDARQTFKDKLDAMTHNKETEMDKMWRQYQKILSAYLKNTEDLRLEYNVLSATDTQNTTSIEQHSEQILQATNTISTLKDKYTTSTHERDFYTTDLVDQRNRSSKYLTQMKKDLITWNKKDKIQVMHLTACATGTVNRLNDLVKKGESLLQLTAICRKFETEKEKVLPWTDQVEYGEDEENPKDKENVEEDDDPKEKEVVNNDEEETVSSMKTKSFLEQDFNFHKFEKFWFRHNRVKLDCVDLSEEKVSLQQENEALKSLLKDYMSALAMSNNTEYKFEAVLAKSDTMTVGKYGSTPLTTAKKKINPRARPVTCIEASTSIAVKHNALRRKSCAAVLYS